MNHTDQHQSNEAEQKEIWVTVELMGHDKTAGRYSFWNGLHRIDVPQEDGNSNSFLTEAIGNDAIFRIRFVDEDTARLAAKQLRPQPIGVWELRKEMLRLAQPESESEVKEPPSVFEHEDLDDDYRSSVSESEVLDDHRDYRF